MRAQGRDVYENYDDEESIRISNSKPSDEGSYAMKLTVILLISKDKCTIVSQADRKMGTYPMFITSIIGDKKYKERRYQTP